MEDIKEEFSAEVRLIGPKQASQYNNGPQLPKYNDDNHHNNLRKGHHCENGAGGQSNQTMFQEVDSDEEIFHRVNGLFDDNVKSYHDNPNSNSDSDDVVFDRKGSFDSTTEALFQTKPLMHPRKRTKVKTKHGRGFIYKCVWPLVYILLAIGAVIALIFIIIYLFGFFTGKFGVGKDSVEVVLGCNHMSKKTAWTAAFPKLLIESSFRMVDVNEDGVLDVIFGFATGADSYHVPDHICDIYFNGSHPCLGGVLALNGIDGKELWRHYTNHEVFALNCGYDVDNDGVKDCLAGGRVSTFLLISGKTGNELWSFQEKGMFTDMNMYTGQFIPDIDGDRVPDILNIHGGDPFGEPGSETRLPGMLMLFSGKTGKVLKKAMVPDGRESYFSPIVFRRRGGLGILFGTGGETHGGALWFISLSDLYKGSINKAYAIYTDPYKGVMTPPVLLDMTGDGTLDIVVAIYNSTTMLIDGDTLDVVWDFTYPSSETYITPAPGYYTDDDVPDFLVHWQHGPGFPIYYYSVTTILDGATGKAVLEPYIRDTVGAQASPLTVSVEGHGNDIFLFFTADCVGHEGEGEEYKFIKGTNVHEQTRSDFCKLRYNTEGINKLNALNRHVHSPGFPLYNSMENKDLEHSAWVNTTAEALAFLKTHPEHNKKYNEWKAWRDHYLKTGQFSKKSNDDGESSVDDDNLYDTLSLMLQSILNKDDDQNGYSDDSAVQYSPEEIKHFLKTDPTVKKYYDKYKGGESIDDSTLNSYLEKKSDPRLQSGEGNNEPIFSNGYHSRMIDESSINDKMPALHRTKYGSGSQSYPSNSSPNKLYSSPRSRSDNYRLQSGIFESPDDTRNTQYKPYRSNIDTDAYVPYDKYQNQFQENSRIKSRNRDYDDNWRDIRGKRKKRNVDIKQNTFKSNSAKYKRKRRHVGPHDGGNLQRLISTGTIAPTLLPKDHPSYNHSIDVIFATFWFYPAKTEVILPEDQKCIDDKMSKQTDRFNINSKYYGMDNDGYEHAVTHECLEASGHVLPEDGVYESQSLKDPYIRHMGQLTVYRITFTCDCIGDVRMSELGHKCSQILPYDQQQWSSYMGSDANGIWKTRT